MSWICISGASASIRLLSGVPAGERVPSRETYERIAAAFGWTALVRDVAASLGPDRACSSPCQMVTKGEDEQSVEHV